SGLVSQGMPEKTVRIQLNRTEYYQGKWATRVSSDLTRFDPVPVSPDFDPAKDVFVRVSIDNNYNGDETSVRIHLDPRNASFPGGPYSFRLTGKNSEPDLGGYWQPTLNQSLGDSLIISRLGDPLNITPYLTGGPDATKYRGSSPVLQVSFPQEMSSTDAGQIQIGNRTREPILNSV